MILSICCHSEPRSGDICTRFARQIVRSVQCGENLYHRNRDSHLHSLAPPARAGVRAPQMSVAEKRSFRVTGDTNDAP
jgi:hypothetical protein